MVPVSSISWESMCASAYSLKPETRRRTSSDSSVSCWGYGNTMSSWISPRARAFEKEDTVVVAMVTTSSAVGVAVLEQREEHDRCEDEEDPEHHEQVRAGDVPDDADEEPQRHQGDVGRDVRLEGGEQGRQAPGTPGSSPSPATPSAIAAI